MSKPMLIGDSNLVSHPLTTGLLEHRSLKEGMRTRLVETRHNIDPLALLEGMGRVQKLLGRNTTGARPSEGNRPARCTDCQLANEINRPIDSPRLATGLGLAVPHVDVLAQSRVSVRIEPTDMKPPL